MAIQMPPQERDLRLGGLLVRLTVRRRVAQLAAQGRLITQVLVEPRRLGLPTEAKLLLHVAGSVSPAPWPRPWRAA